jgi:ferrous iron transport protein A
MPHRHKIFVPATDLQVPSLTLKRAKVGTKLRVSRLECDVNTCQRLREMGFGESAQIVKMADHGSVVCLVCGARVGLSSQLASGIIVEPVTTP